MIFRRKLSSLAYYVILIVIVAIIAVVTIPNNGLLMSIFILALAFWMAYGLNKEVEAAEDRLIVRSILGRKKVISDIKSASITYMIFSGSGVQARSKYYVLAIDYGKDKKIRLDIFFYEDKEGLVREVERIMGHPVENRERLSGDGRLPPEKTSFWSRLWR